MEQSDTEIDANKSESIEESSSGYYRRTYLRTAAASAMMLGVGTTAAESTTGYGTNGYGDGEYGGGTSDDEEDTTDEEDPVSVSTSGESAIDETCVTVEGTLDHLGDAKTVDVTFEYREHGETAWIQTPSQTLEETTSFDHSLQSLSPDTEYEYRAAVVDPEESDDGEVRTFSTLPKSEPPTIEEFSLTETSPPNPHAEIEVDWVVADSTGDLASVGIEVVSEDGTSLESELIDVSGDADDGSESFELKHGAGERYLVGLSVADHFGHETTESEWIET